MQDIVIKNMNCVYCTNKTNKMQICLKSEKLTKNIDGVAVCNI